jgi:hypothetical protein
LRFTVRRPADAEVSPCCHRPSGGNVSCGVDVGIAWSRIAGDALENRLALAVFRRNVTTVGASLRRVRCRDELEAPVGLLLEPGNQQPPAVAVDLAIKAPFLRHVGSRAFAGPTCRAGHRPYAQVLDADGVEAARHNGGCLFHPVTTAIGFAGPQPRNGPLRLRPPVRSALRARPTPLQPPQPLRLARAKARNAQQLSVRQCSRDRNAAINPDNAAIARSRNGFWDGGKSDVPAPSSIQRDAIRLHRCGDSAGPTEPHPADLRYPNLPVAAVQRLDVGPFYADLPKSFMLVGFTPGRATMGAVEKVAHRLGEVPQRLLLDGLRSGCQPVVFCPGRGQLATLLVITRCTASRLPVLVLLDGKIPHIPCMATMFSQRRRLLRAGKQPKPGHGNNVGTSTDNLPKGGTRRPSPRLEPRVSKPQN